MPAIPVVSTVARKIATTIASSIGLSGDQIRPWLLETLAWNDAGYWKDSATWIDD